MARLYISQDRLTAWMSEDRVKVEADLMTLLPDGRAFRIKPALHFLRVAAGGEDPNGLLGKVKTVKMIKEQGGEHLQESVILGETAYDVQEGFLGEPVNGPAASKG